MVKDHLDIERGNPLSPHGYSFRLAARVLLKCIIPQTGYHSLCYTSRGALAGSSDYTKTYTSQSKCYYENKEGNVLFKDALNTFYLRLYGVRHMVKDHSDSERGNPLPQNKTVIVLENMNLFPIDEVY